MELDPARRERILDAAARLVVANGLQCSMAAIADSAGVATGSIYNYFKSKDDLIRGVYRRLSEILCRALIPEADPAPGARDGILRYIYDYIDFIWEDRDRAVLFEYLSNVPIIAPGEMREAFVVVSRYSRSLMARGREAGLLSDLPDDVLAAFIGGGIRNALKWRRLDPAPLTAEERDHIALMSWNALAMPHESRRLHQIADVESRKVRGYPSGDRPASPRDSAESAIPDPHSP